MDAEPFDEGEFFGLIGKSGARVGVSDYDHVDPETVRAIRELAEAPRPLEELKARWEREIGAEELAENIELIDWFCRRYPTPEARLRYARRAYERWRAAMPG